MERDWYDLIDEFRRQYPNKSYYLYKVGESFAEFLNTKTELVQKYPFLPHLADYQWLEVALYNAPDFSYPANFQAELTWSEETFEGYKPFWNPVSKFVTYPYPLPALQRQINQVLEDVERFEEFPMERLRVQEQSTNMFVYRDPEHFYVRMFELNPMTTAIVQLSQEAPTYMELFKTLQATTPGLQELPLENVIVEGVKFFHQCHEARMLLGSVSSV
jgi:hypothetical protein